MNYKLSSVSHCGAPVFSITLKIERQRVLPIQAMQRGASCTAQMLKEIVQGLELSENTKVYVVDLLPNRLIC